MTRVRPAAAFAAVVVVSLLVPSSARAATDASAQDVAFLRSTAESDLTEIASAGVAAERARSDGVRLLASRLHSDHVESLREVHGLADQSHVALPAGLDKSDQKAVDDLRFVPAAGFDAKYLDGERKAHESAIADAQEEVRNGTNDRVVAWARTELGLLSEHLRLVDTVSTTTSATPTASPSATLSSVAATARSRATATTSGDVPTYGWALIALAGAVVVAGAARRLVRR